MSSKPDTAVHSFRLVLLGLLFLAGLTPVAVRLYQVQIVESYDYRKDQDRQSIRRVQTPGVRGKILDRNGKVLAECRPSYCVVLYADELRRPGKWSNTVNAVEAQIARLSADLHLPIAISRKTIERHIRQSLPMPLIVWRDVDEKVQAILSEKADRYTGVELSVFPERFYPGRTTAAQVVGYVGRDRPKEEENERFHFYYTEMEGRSGLELQYNGLLTGKAGEHHIRVDARGYRRDVWEVRPATPGGNLQTTLDIDVQRTLEKAMGGYRGAGVVIDPRNGEILAMASTPGYDNNEMVPFIPKAIWQDLNTDRLRRPLLNRTIQGIYPPGSTFKPFTALAGLTAGMSPEWEHTCNGVFTLGTMRLKCWNTYGHHTISLHEALAQSCNVYFCQMAQEIGYAPILATAGLAGFGRKTGVDLPFENAGILPTSEWKQTMRNEPWRPGDTSLISIGQGLLSVTPLQLAVAVSALANGGEIVRPHVNKSADSTPIAQTGWDRRYLDIIRSGMVDVVERGTGRRVRIDGLKVAGKTGTAEYTRDGERFKHTWMIAYAPADAPQAVIVVVAEDGVSGGLTVAPIIRQTLLSLFPQTAVEDGAAQVPQTEAAD